MRRALHERIKARADAQQGGNLSAYLVSLAERDLDHAPLPSTASPDILARMAGIYSGHLSLRLGPQLAAHGVDQPGLLNALLAQLTVALERGPSTAAAPCRLHCAITRLDLEYPDRPGEADPLAAEPPPFPENPPAAGSSPARPKSATRGGSAVRAA